MRNESEIRDLRGLAVKQQGISRARDYWEGVEDALAWANGESVPPIEAHLLVHRKTPPLPKTRTVMMPDSQGNTVAVEGPYRSEEDFENMRIYRLDEKYDLDTHAYLGLFCTGCGMVYPSIEDRMLKPPDVCSGCFRRAGHG